MDFAYLNLFFVDSCYQMDQRKNLKKFIKILPYFDVLLGLHILDYNFVADNF